MTLEDDAEKRDVPIKSMSRTDVVGRDRIRDRLRTSTNMIWTVLEGAMRGWEENNG